PWPSDGCDDDVALTRDSGQVAGGGVTHGHRRVAVDQHRQQRPAYCLAAADDDDARATQRPPGFDELDARPWRRRTDGLVLARGEDQPQVLYRHAVDILERWDAIDGGCGIKRLRQRQLEDHAVRGAIGGKRIDPLLERALVDGAVEAQPVDVDAEAV